MVQNAVQNAFRIRFPNRNLPLRKTTLKNVRICQNTGTSLNRNKSNSGRRRTAQNEVNITSVREQLLLEETPLGVSARRYAVIYIYIYISIYFFIILIHLLNKLLITKPVFYTFVDSFRTQHTCRSFVWAACRHL